MRTPGPLTTFILTMVMVFLQTGCSTDSPIKADQTVISPLESKVVFIGAEKSGFQETHYRVTTDNYTTNAHVGVWTQRTAPFPHARITYAFLLPGYQYLSDYDVDTYVSNLKLGSANKVTKLEAGVASNDLGRVTYRKFTAGSHHCVALSQSWGSSSSDTSAGATTKQLFGHYCGGSGETVDPDQIVKRIGVKGESLSNSYNDRAAVSQQGLSLPLVIHWEGYDESLSGKLIATNVNSRRGRIWLSLPNGQGECAGEWKWLSGKYGEGSAVKGTWKTLCTNGVAAEGVYQGTDRHRFSGKGKDRQGREIRFNAGDPANSQPG